MGHFARECRAPRIADEEAPTEFALMANTESKRSDQVKEGVGYNAVPPPAADLYISLKKDLSWTGLPEFVDDTVTNYSRPLPTVESTSAEGEGSKGRQLSLKIIHIRDLHSDLLVTDHMGDL
nr:hypothetical protein [Tanacetum cinerariifolium]